MREAEVQVVVEFLRKIGLEVCDREGVSGFCPGILVEGGRIVVDRAICEASNLLHEAGHVAVVPTEFRHLLNGNLSKGIKEMFDHLEEMDLHPDSPIYRAALQCGDQEATAWAWAAGKALNLPEHSIIREVDYSGAGNEVRTQLQMRHYGGINGLHHAGLCNMPRPGMQTEVYPQMKAWLQTATTKCLPHWLSTGAAA